MLKTEFKNWYIYLSKFSNIKINCLDLGSREGEFTCWMLNNLCNNNYSKVYSVDKWDDKLDYANDNFKPTEQKFNDNVIETGKEKQNVKMKMTNDKALIILRDISSIIFDFIFIKSCYDPKNIISEAILSWDLLNEDGIMIFDDYNYNALKKNYLKPKIAIDAFIEIYSTQIKVLHIGYQYIIKKINKKNFINIELENYYNLLEKINFYKYDYIQVLFDDYINNDLNFNLKISKKKNNYLFDEMEIELNKISDIVLKYPEIIKSNFIKEEFINNMNENDIKNNNIISDFLKRNIDSKILKEFSQISPIFELINKNKNKNIFISAERLKIDIDDLKKIKILNNKNIIICTDIIYNFNDLIKNTKKYNTYYLMQSKNSKTEYILNKSNIFNFSFNLSNIILCLNIQEIGGNAYFLISSMLDRMIIEIIYILKKYYKKIIIKNKYSDKIGLTISLYCYDFNGVPIKELAELNNIFLKINTDNFKNGNLFLNSIIDINNKEIENNITNKLNIFVKKKLNSIVDYVFLLNDIYTFINDNNNKTKYIYNIKKALYKYLVTNFFILIYKNKNYII